ncbi:hypothetical protein [Moraxella sp. ZY200743]
MINHAKKTLILGTYSHAIIMRYYYHDDAQEDNHDLPLMNVFTICNAMK